MRRIHARAGACALLLLLNHRVYSGYPVGLPFLVCEVGRHGQNGQGEEAVRLSCAAPPIRPVPRAPQMVPSQGIVEPQQQSGLGGAGKSENLAGTAPSRERT